MKSRKWGVGSRFLFLFFLLVLLDQCSKWFFRSRSFTIIDGFFSLTPSTNTGSAFGLFQSVPNVLFIILSIVVIIGGIVLVRKEVIPEWFALLFLAGVTGNLVDRVLFGAVTDFIAFSFWPSFNIADSLMVVSVVGLVWMEMCKK